MNRSPSDADLIDAVRNGTISAYGELYERHVSAAYNLARHLSHSPAQADDLVSEAFAKVLETIRSGRGPDSAFRAYLLTALRHTSYDIVRRDRKIELAEDVSEVDGISIEALRVPFIDPAVAGLERALAARAFARLPERWQAVLWHTQIEDQSPAEVAPILGLTPHGVSALAYRAREGLKQAYLQVYLADTTEQRCRATVDRLGAWIRGGLAKREKAQVESHLDECARCVALAEELANISGTMRAFIAPLVLGSGTAGYLTAGAGTMVAGPAGGGPATTLPRQFLGIVGSVLALIAALIIGLTAGDPTEPPSTTVPPAPAPVPPEPPAPPGPPTFAPIPPPGPVPPATTPTIGGG